ncbi:PQQ-dependent sugar dehydrogenase [Allomuricauda sp. SCSIO 65647]|uniref:PQQ-dependent sugar dehydrogenase n=1 Tax=Allomuricauda sp. SCSIO 65647 TaxID=2908843 RepID=UPI001F4333FE|nr:PQQ-dependent sugar dehydrogenase [Muricauda sp. SCSIO 65647]UJH68931.1 PQQ-dependent sugar dehydrogenase [Muricauda sp. SCSIO 65647]
MRFSILLVSILLFGCGQNLNEPKTPNAVLPVKETVFEGLNRPWGITFLSEEEALVTEKNGHMVKVDLQTKTKKVIKGFPSDLTDSIGAVHIGDNSGIFEVIKHPDFTENQVIYFSYAAKKPGVGKTTKFVRARLQHDSLADIKTVLVADPYNHINYHYGGGMVIGHDRKLYITVGERLFWEHDEPVLPIAQDVTDKRGKIHRFDLDGGIPEDNPDFGPDAVPSIFALGIRNTQGIAIQPKTNTLWFTEHGTIQGDELNILKPGANYGWPNRTTGRLRSKEYKPPKIEGVEFTPPTWFWHHTVAPTGLCFYTGDEFPTWKNNLFVPGLSRGSLWRFHIEGDTIKNVEELFLDDRVRSRKVAQSPEGKLYLLTDEENGKIIRIKAKPLSE